MHSTYINDNMLSVYPFAAGAQLPFSCSCITGLGICVTGFNPDIYVTNINVQETAITLYLSNKKGEFIYELNATESTSSCKQVLNKETGKLNAWLTIGSIQETDIGSYIGPFYIEPSCITLMPTDVYLGLTSVAVNGEQKAISASELKFKFKGMIKSAIDQGKVILTGYPEDNQTHVEYTEQQQQVTKVNACSVASSAADKYDGTIILDTKDPSYVTISIDNAVSYNEVYQNYLSAKKIVPYDNLATIITINGTSKVPNCYDSTEDEANVADN